MCVSLNVEIINLPINYYYVYIYTTCSSSLFPTYPNKYLREVPFPLISIISRTHYRATSLHKPMARGSIKTLCSFFFLALLISLLVFGPAMTEARPFNILKPDRRPCFDGNKGFFDVWSLGAIKQSGPSPGQGNKYTDSVNKDGPSPGKGH